MEERCLSQPEEFLIHTQRENIAAARTDNLGVPLSLRGSADAAGRRHWQVCGTSSPNRRSRGRARGGISAGHACTTGVTTPAQISPCRVLSDFAEERTEEEEDHADAVLHKENEKLRLQLQVLRDEQITAADSHARVVASVVQERNDLFEQLQKNSIASADFQQDTCVNLEEFIDTVAHKESPANTCTMTPWQGDGASPDEQPEITGGDFDAFSSEVANAEAEAVHILEGIPGDRYQEALRFEDSGANSFGISSEGRLLRTKYATARCETLASRAQCWEMQGALRKVQQEKNHIEQKMKAILSTAELSTDSKVVAAWPRVCPPPSGATSPSFPPSVSGVLSPTFPACASGMMSPSFPPHASATPCIGGACTPQSVCAVSPTFPPRVLPPRVSVASGSHGSCAVTSPGVPPRIPVTRRTFGGTNSFTPALISASPSPFRITIASTGRTSPPKATWAADAGHCSVRNLTPSRRLALNTIPTPFRQHRSGSNSSRSIAAPMIAPPPPVAKSVAGGLSTTAQVPTVAVSSVRVLAPSASTPSFIPGPLTVVAPRQYIETRPVWVRDQSSRCRDLSPPPNSLCPCCGSSQA